VQQLNIDDLFAGLDLSHQAAAPRHVYLLNVDVISRTGPSNRLSFFLIAPQILLTTVK